MAKFECTVEVNVTTEEFVEKLSNKEKLDLVDVLSKTAKKEGEEFSKNRNKEFVIEYLRGLSLYDKKRVLASALYVPSYVDDDAMRQALEPIITAR